MDALTIPVVKGTVWSKILVNHLGCFILEGKFRTIITFMIKPRALLEDQASAKAYSQGRETCVATRATFVTPTRNEILQID